jgi:hypothetical protein
MARQGVQETQRGEKWPQPSSPASSRKEGALLFEMDDIVQKNELVRDRARLRHAQARLRQTRPESQPGPPEAERGFREAALRRTDCQGPCRSRRWLVIWHASAIVRHGGVVLAILRAVLGVLQVALAMQMMLDALRALHVLPER